MKKQQLLPNCYIAKKDIMCWKILRIHNSYVYGMNVSDYKPWCHKRLLRPGRVLKARTTRDNRACSTGCHSFPSKKGALVYFVTGYDNELWKAIIPKGTFYHLAKGWKYRADKIKLVKRVK